MNSELAMAVWALLAKMPCECHSPPRPATHENADGVTFCDEGVAEYDGAYGALEPLPWAGEVRAVLAMLDGGEARAGKVERVVEAARRWRKTAWLEGEAAINGPMPSQEARTEADYALLCALIDLDDDDDALDGEGGEGAT